MYGIIISIIAVVGGLLVAACGFAVWLATIQTEKERGKVADLDLTVEMLEKHTGAQAETIGQQWGYIELMAADLQDLQERDAEWALIVRRQRESIDDMGAVLQNLASGGTPPRVSWPENVMAWSKN